MKAFKRFNQGLCLVLALSIAVPASVRADDAKAQNTVLRTVLDEISSRYDLIFAKFPQQLLNDVETERNLELSQDVQEKQAALKSGVLSVADFRKQVSELSVKAIQDQKEELFYQLQGFAPERLDAIAEVMKGNRNYRDALMTYQSAFTRTEKANALAGAVYQDLDHLMSMLSKRSHLMSKDEWMRDLGGVQSMYNTKGGRKWLKALGVAVLGVAAVGLVTWAVASSVYGSKLDQRKAELEKQYNDLKAKLDQEYNAFAQKLDADEKAYLRDNGFVFTTCGTYEMPDSIICNRYNYQVFSGSKYCTVQCYKNLATGQETLHTAPTCTSPFIPADCYDPSEYDRGYHDGYSDGYNSGYAQGEHDGANDGQADGWNNGQHDGYSDGYNDGYKKGFDSGYSNGGVASVVLPISSGPAVGMMSVATASLAEILGGNDKSDFDRGYQDGLEDAKQLLNLGGVLQ